MSLFLNVLLKGGTIGFLLLGFNVKSAKVDQGLSLTPQSAAHHQGCGFFPANKLKFPVRPTGHMNEQTFRNILKVVATIYDPIFKQNGRPRLEIFPRWTDDTVNASAFVCAEPAKLGAPDYPTECYRMQTSPGIYSPVSILKMYGGLARHPQMTPEGFVLVACHEIGHHLAGYPRYGNNAAWAATEGQSDYFATAKCARKIFRAMGSNTLWAQRANVVFEVRNACGRSFGVNTEEAAICMRSAMAGLSLANVLGSLSPGTPPVKFATVDKTVVAQTFEGHPKAQCRLDTYFAGSICRIPDNENFSAVDPRRGACLPGRVENTGVRPACWYAR